MHKLKELRERLATQETKFVDRYVGTRMDDGATDGKPSPGSKEKGEAMAEALRQRKIESDKTMKKQDPMECVRRALGNEQT